MGMTPAERKRASRAKARLLAEASAIIEVGRGPGGAERISEIVIRKVAAALAAGELSPTVKDGLAAEKLRDAREKAVDDRKTMTALAMLLSGARPPERLLVGDGMTVEGTFSEVTEDE